jgi:hypothetical protein
LAARKPSLSADDYINPRSLDRHLKDCPKRTSSDAFRKGGPRGTSTFNPNDIETWGNLDPLLITHDLGRGSTGGKSPYQCLLFGVGEAADLPRDAARATASAWRKWIVADLGSKPAYADHLVKSYRGRLIWLHATRYGDGFRPKRKTGLFPTYEIGRSYLVEILQDGLASGQVRISDPAIREACDVLKQLQACVDDAAARRWIRNDSGGRLAVLAWAAERFSVLTAFTFLHNRP